MSEGTLTSDCLSNSADKLSNRKLYKLIVASSIGNALEWFHLNLVERLLLAPRNTALNFVQSLPMDE